MDNETLEHLLALRAVNKALIDGLKAAVYCLEQVEQISQLRRKSMIESLKGLIVHSEEIYGEAQTKH